MHTVICDIEKYLVQFFIAQYILADIMWSFCLIYSSFKKQF